MAALAGMFAGIGTAGKVFAGLSAASTGLSALGKIRQGQAAEQAANFQAKVQEQQAASERQAAEAEASDFRRRGSARRAASLARLSGSGVEASSGSPLLVDEAFVKDVALGSSRIRHSGEVRGTRLEQQAGLTRAQGRNARRAGTLHAGQSLLSGGASILSGMQSFS